ncbi:Bud site selection protein bud4 [Marasmius crinis-equi]|uniref:Bud site selection protein bud4 n=1 Tax=Marasmius crinis-equi TaxID=585013 RepID=A0ABR3G225_9AGAR
MKSSILRDSGMGWNSPPSSSSTSDPTSPLRLAKRDPSQPTQADLARRSSSSYRHMRTNNLVSKSPFKSQIPTPSTPSRKPPVPVLFPTRRVSGEKRPRPASMHAQAEEENERPFALKRDRKQSKTYQGLIEREPVTKSPFRKGPFKPDHDEPLPAPPVPHAHEDELRQPDPPFSSRVSAGSGSPLRSSLVSRRMHGPRLSGDRRRGRRKTVTWNDKMDVMEIDRIKYDDEDDEEALDTDDYEDEDMDDPFFQGQLQPQPQQDTDNQTNSDEDSYESVELSDSGHHDLAPGLVLDGDMSINGLVDDLFAGHAAPVMSTPPREHKELPVDLETEDGIPLGRSHHRERTLAYHQQLHQESPAKQSPIPFNHPISFPDAGSGSGSPLPTTASTPPRHSPVSSPPLGRSTHAERAREARIDEHAIDKDVNMLPDSPSPVKPKKHSTYDLGDGLESAIPKFDLSAAGITDLPERADESANADIGDDPFAMPHIKDERLPEGNSSYVSAASANENDHSGMANLSAMEKELGQPNERLLSTSLEASASPNPNTSASFSNSPLPSTSRSSGNFSPLSPNRQVVRRSPLPPIPAGVAPHVGTPPSGLAPRSTPSPRLRPRISREDVRARLLGARRFGSGSPVPQPQLQEGEEERRDSPRLSNVDKGKGRAIDDILDDPPPQGVRSRESSIVMENEGVEEVVVETAIVVGVAQHYHHEGEENDDEEEREELERDEMEEEAQEEEDMEEEDDEEEFGVVKKAPPMLGTLGLGGTSSKFNLDFGSKFGLGRLGIDLDDMEVSSYEPARTRFNDNFSVQESVASRASGDSQASRQSKTSSTTSSNMVRMGASEEDVSMDMRSALDRLMDDVGANVDTPQPDTSMATTEEDVESDDDDQPLGLRVGQSHQAKVMMQSTAEGAALSRTASESSHVPPPMPPPKDNIKAREEMILQRRREMRRMEEEQEDMLFNGAEIHVPAGKSRGIGLGRPSRRRSMSTGDVHDLVKKGEAKLDVDPVAEEDPLEATIEKELQKMDTEPKKKYHIREREAIYASSTVSHMAGPGDVNVGKAWRPIRRPSDMNEYSKQIKEYRANQNPGKAYGKVFVKVVGVRNLHVPIPVEPTTLTCTLNNGIHFVTTPECRLARDCPINQEFELIEHSKLEFTLTLKIKRDPHIITQFKSLAPPPLPPQQLPPPMVHQASSSSSKNSSRGGMLSFFSSSPKKPKEKEKEKERPAPVTQFPPAPVHRLPENLARYMKPDGTFARAFISFKDVAPRCDTKLFETSFPLIGQRLELGGKASTLQVGEMVLQMFRLPPLPGIPPDQLPQSLDECHRGLRHVNWHKVTYFEGTLTQSGGDCSSWRRRRLRVVGGNLVAFNDVTKRVTATINLKNAIAIEDDQESMLSPVSGKTSRSSREYDGLYGVERSFRLIFPGNEEICFFADTDEEKARWLEILRALVGHIPPHPLWAELLWQRQTELNARAGDPGAAGR